MKNRFSALIFSCLACYLAAGCASSNKSPKVDLDEFRFTATYWQLPHSMIDTSYHTYSVDVEAGLTSRLGLSKDEIAQTIRIEGMKKLYSLAHLQISARFEDVVVTATEIKEKVDVIKDKDGHETGKKSSFYAEIGYNFASMATVKDYRGALISTFDLATRDRNMVYRSEYYRSAAEAKAFMILGMVTLQGKLTRECITNAINNLNNDLTYNYGIREAVVSDMLWVLDSRSHPEYEAHRQAWINFKQVMSKMSTEEPVDELRTEMQPVIDYYNKVKKNYSSDDKRDRRLLYASYYNLAKIYYYLDMPEAAMNEANELVMNDYAAKDGQSLEAAASELKTLFRQTRYNTRHFPLDINLYQGPAPDYSQQR
jgi:hypothetical protein